MTTTAQMIAAINTSADNRVAVEGGEGEDHDTGYAYINSDGEVMVAWKSGVSTKFYDNTGIEIAE